MAKSDSLRNDDFENNKNVFILAFQGGTMMEERIRRICNAYSEDETLEINMQTLKKDMEDAETQKAKLKDFIKQTAL